MELGRIRCAALPLPLRGAGEETAAIEKAKGILSEGVKVFLQTSRSMTTTRQLGEDSNVREQVVSLLSGMAHKFQQPQGKFLHAPAAALVNTAVPMRAWA